MTARAWLLVSLIFSLAFAGLATLNGAVLALALPLLAYLALGLWWAPGEVQVKAERKLEQEQAASGRPVGMSLAIENVGPALEEVLLEDRLPPRLSRLSGREPGRLWLPPGGSARFECVVQGGRGDYRFPELRLTAGDPFGLFRLQASAEAPARLLVFPQVGRLQRIAIRPQATHGFSGPIPAHRGGSGTDFFGVRDYQAGDPPRRINWPASARREGQIFSNEFEQEAIANVGIIVDGRAPADLHSGDESLFEHSASAAATLAETFLRDGHRVSLLIFGFGIQRVFPGYGKATLARILRALAEARTGVNFALQSLQALPTRFLPTRAQIVLISPLAMDDLAALTALRSHGYEVLVVSPDPVAFESRALASHPEREAAVRLAHLERALLLRKLRRIGVTVVDWPVETALEGRLRAALACQPGGQQHLRRILGERT